ncbi:MAG: ferrochelatase [Gammaproteobacteria bacterium]|nr:ferrochelatase [Gammaproteobacteria bacterium]
MKYRDESKASHNRKSSIGVLLVNLGTPDAPTTTAVRRYLAQFLWDPRVVEIPRILWWPILHLIILNTRPAKSAKLYRKIWTAQGSPLLINSQRQCEAIADRLQQRFQNRIVVSLAMRYGQPSISEGLEQLYEAGADKLLVLPLYPQYSATTTASTFDALADEMKTRRKLPEIRFVYGYCDEPSYIKALAARIEQGWRYNGRAKLLLLSYHGLPRRCHELGDPYYRECHKTSKLLAELLGLEDTQWRISFQSRLGRLEWLKPYTDKTLEQLPAEGIKSVDVFCPGFAADCLETLEEIAMGNRQRFLAAGGEQFSYIPALNDSAEHIDALTSLILRHIEGWPQHCVAPEQSDP